MKFRILAGVACAALMGLGSPVTAATSPELPSATNNDPAARAVDAFYASRHGAVLWLDGNDAAARELIGVLQRSFVSYDAGHPVA